MSELRCVAVGYLSHKLDEIVFFCDDDFADTWYSSIVNSMDSATYAPTLLTEEEMQAELDDYVEWQRDIAFFQGGC